MALTQQQLTTLKADIQSRSGPGGAFENYSTSNPDHVLDVFVPFYNALSNPEFIVWRTNVPTHDIRSVLSWAEYDTLSVSKQNAFQFLCSNGVVNAALTNIRAGIQSIFGGQQQTNNLTAMIAIAKRTATRIEALLATGTGTTQTPGTMTFEGQISHQDITAAANLGS